MKRVKERKDAVVRRSNEHGDKVAINLDCSSGDKTAIGSHLLIAVGRMPNTADLGPENNGRGAFTHTSYNDYEIVAGNLLDHDRRRVSDRITAYALYIDPPLGRAGMTEVECESQGAKLCLENAR